VILFSTKSTAYLPKAVLWAAIVAAAIGRGLTESL
jgi:hypothetical protein